MDIYTWLFAKARKQIITSYSFQLCDTADRSALWYSKHVCCVIQQTCLLCHTADMSAVRHSRVTQQTCLLCDRADMAPPLLATQHHGFVSKESGGLPNPVLRHKTMVLFRRRDVDMPAFLRHKTKVLCRKQKLWTHIYYLLLDLDTCLTPAAKNWKDLNCRL